MKLERILVGFDGSENARRALEWATDLAAALDAELVVAHAVGLIPRDDHGQPAPTGAPREALEQHFEATWSQWLRAAGVRFQLAVHDGAPVDVLLALSEDLSADLIVIGRRGAGGAPDLLLGSTSTQVARHATVPVVIVPHDAPG